MARFFKGGKENWFRNQIELKNSKSSRQIWSGTTYSHETKDSKNKDLGAILAKDRVGQVRSAIALSCPGHLSIPVPEEFLVNVVCTVDSSAFRDIVQLESATVVAKEEPPVIPAGRFEEGQKWAAAI